MDFKAMMKELAELSPEEKKALGEALGFKRGGREPTNRTKETLYVEPSEGAGLNFIMGENGGRIAVPLAVVVHIAKSPESILKIAEAHGDDLVMTKGQTFAEWVKGHKSWSATKPTLWNLGDLESRPLYTKEAKAKAKAEWEARKAAK